jgi:protein-disulfide isomerase-like protein with CxxC motif
MSLAFGLTWEYRCPFARIVSDHVITALEGGADWDVTWVPFSLTQAHVATGEVDAWDDPSKADTLYAMEAGIVVRDRFPDRFLAVQRGLFDVRHDGGQDLRVPSVVHGVLADAGVDPDAVVKELDAGWPRAEFRKAHTDAVDTRAVFGVPTFLVGDSSVFVRLMDRPNGDAALAQRTIERVIDTITGWPSLNEFKHTSIPR